MSNRVKHVFVVINSFNSSAYALQAMRLCADVHEALDGVSGYSVVCVFGGCASSDLVVRVADKTAHARQYFVFTQRNLFDYTQFSVLHLLSGHDHGTDDDDVLCVCLHDTCLLIKELFRSKIMNLPHPPSGWVFAHALGLYNIGVCSLKFVIDEFGPQWRGVRELSKRQSIALEHLRQPVGGLRGLRYFSKVTLNAIATKRSRVEELDMHSIMPVEFGGQQKHAVLLAALGVFKMTFSQVTYSIPIWSRHYAPATIEQFDQLTRKEELSNEQWILALAPAR